MASFFGWELFRLSVTTDEESTANESCREKETGRTANGKTDAEAPAKAAICKINANINSIAFCLIYPTESKQRAKIRNKKEDFLFLR